LLLGIKAKALEEVVYYSSYIVIDPGSVPSLRKRCFKRTRILQTFRTIWSPFEAQTGAEAVKTLLMELDLDKKLKFYVKNLKLQLNKNANVLFAV